MKPQNLFDPKQNVSLNSEVFSEPVEFNASATITALSNNVSIYKNSTLVASPVVVSPSDLIKLSVTSSSDYSDHVFGIVEVTQEEKSSKHIFSCTTKNELVSIEEFKDLEPFELEKYYEGSTYVPSSYSNKLFVYEDIQNNPVATITGLRDDTPLASNVDSTDSLVICSYYTNKLHRINILSNEIVGVIDVPGKPYAAIAVPDVPDIDNISNLWVTLADKNKVIVLDNQDQIIQEFSVGNRPLGITIDPTFKNVWVANSYDDTVSRFLWNDIGANWIQTVYSVGQKPFEIACDSASNAWVSCASDNKVYRITKDGQISSYVVGENPRGIAHNSNKIWVAVSQEKKVVALDLLGNLVHTLNNIGEIPFAIGSIPPTRMAANVSDILNITDDIRFNSLSDVLQVLDYPAINKLLDSFTITDVLATPNRVSDLVTLTDAIVGGRTLQETLSLLDSIDVVLDQGEPVRPPASTDTSYSNVSLQLNAEDPNVVSPYISTRYLVFEAQDFYSGTGGSINELIIIDDQGNTLTYTLREDGAYDLTTNGVPTYWNGE